MGVDGARPGVDVRGVSPRWSLAATSLLVALIFGWAATVLPWSRWTLFAALTVAVAVVHAVTAALAGVGSSRRLAAWRVQSLVALVYLAYCTWNVASSSVYVAALYGGLGRGIGVGLAACWAIVVLLTVPLSVWGIVATGGIRVPGRARAGAVGTVVLVTVGLVASVRSAVASTRVATPDGWVDRLASIIPPARQRGAYQGPARSLMTETPVNCELSPLDVNVTVLVTFVEVLGRSNAVAHRCVQGASDQVVMDGLKAVLADALPGPIKLDLVTAVHPLSPILPVADALLLRPGLDGVCEVGRCLAPWQLVAAEAFITHVPLSFIPELRFGVDPSQLHRRLGGKGRDPEGLLRIETLSLVADDRGVLHRLSRGRLSEGPAATQDNLQVAARAAQEHILAAQAEDGRFRYVLDPHGGDVSYRGFSIARQAGTTLVLCELGEQTNRVNAVVGKALDMLAALERRSGQLGALSYPAGKETSRVEIGPTALSLISFLSCRDRVGDIHDQRIGRMARFLLRLQRPDGGFHPRLELANGKPIPGSDPLYAGGQAVFALTLLEALAERDPDPVYPTHENLREAVDRSMEYFARDYWPEFARGFFFVEENWHCLAARASLGHHRHYGYEQFCLDYVGFKRRLILDETSGVHRDLIGAYGFGNVLVPHNTGTSGFGEAFAASMAIRKARGDDVSEDRALIRRVLAFLLRQQWTEPECFACTPDQLVVGGMSEHIGSPHIRIDYAQHSWAAMGHGGRMLED